MLSPHGRLGGRDRDREPGLLETLMPLLSLPCCGGLCLLWTVWGASSARAEVGDPTVRTDHPQYAGEGAFQSVEDCVRFATAGEDASQDRAIALYRWILTHQYHLASPQEWRVPGRTPDTAKSGDDGVVPFDANRARFSYGYGLCGTVHAWNEPYWSALGMRPRRRAFPGHTNSEVFYDGSWHAFDTDMAGLLFRQDGIVAGYADIIRDPALAESVKPPLPHYPFAWPGDFDVMKRGWQQVAQGGDWFALYNGGYAAHPGIVRLRAGETFTRYFDRDHFGGPSKRRFWQHMDGGPQRDWTFVNAGEPRHDGAESNSRGHASYCNGEFVYEPDLSQDRCRDGVRPETENVGHRAGSPRLYSRDRKAAAVTVSHFSPYVIAGDPADDANPMTGPATGGLVIEGTLVGNVRAEISADGGQSWQAVALQPNADGRFTLDLTDRVKGRYGWRLRLAWEGDAGLDALRTTTVTQVSQSIYPRLTPDGCQVNYRCGSRGVVAVLPDFGRPESDVKQFEEVSLRSANVEYLGRGSGSRLAYRTRGNKPGQIVFRIAAPAGLQEVRAAIRYPVRVPPPEEADVRLEVSTDEGRTWQEFARSDIPTDNEYSSGWLAGRADVSAAGAREALVRATFYMGGHQAGLMDAQLYGVYTTPSPQRLRLEYGWREDNRLRTHAVEIPAGTAEHKFTVPTGPRIVDDFVRLTAP
jgi:hypothetical protein